MNIFQELAAPGQVLIDIRADHEVVFSEAPQVIAIDIDFPKRGAGQLRQKEILLIGKHRRTSPFYQFVAKDAVAAAEVERSRFRAEPYAAPLHPPNGIAGLLEIEARIVAPLKALRDELVDDQGDFG
jgi:hypothetical protein